jgi:hypothetical protein
MLRSLKEILGYRVQAIDGECGRAKDFLLDDRSWGVRHMVVDIGGWLSEGRVLISPHAAREPIWSSGVIPVGMTRRRARNSPDVESHLPASRRYEYLPQTYYDWEMYWPIPSPFGLQNLGILLPSSVVYEEDPLHKLAADPHLQSVRDLIGCSVEAIDGEVGHVKDLLVQTDGWIICYLVVATHRWVPGRDVLVSPAWVTAVDWPGGLVRMNLQQAEIRSSEQFDPLAAVNRGYEVRLYDYYGRPRYQEAVGGPSGKWYIQDRKGVPRRRLRDRSQARGVRTLRVEEYEHIGGP